MLPFPTTVLCDLQVTVVLKTIYILGPDIHKQTRIKVPQIVLFRSVIIPIQPIDPG